MNSILSTGEDDLLLFHMRPLSRKNWKRYLAVRKLRSKGYTYAAIAKNLGVSKARAFQICAEADQLLERVRKYRAMIIEMRVDLSKTSIPVVRRR